MKRTIFLLLIFLITIFFFLFNCGTPDSSGNNSGHHGTTVTIPGKFFRIAVVGDADKKKSVRLIETDSRTDYTSENAGVVYVSDPSQGVLGGFFTGNSLYLTHDDPDPATADAHDYIVQVDFEGNILKEIDLGDDNAPQEMILNDGFIYMPYILENELINENNGANLATKPISGIKKINPENMEVLDFIKSFATGKEDVGQAFIKKIKDKVYVSYFGFPPPYGLFVPSKVKVFNASTMQISSTIDLDDDLSTQCQNPTNVTMFNNDLYIACWYNPTATGEGDPDRYRGRGAIVKVDSNNDKTVIDLQDYSAKKIISTANHVYVGLQKWDGPKMNYYFDNVFEVNTSDFTIDEQQPIDTEGYQIFHFETIDNKIIFTAEKDNKHFVVIADENFKILKRIQIYKNVNYPKILCAAIK